MTIVRPCIVFGPSVDNYLVRLWTKQPFLADLGLPDPGIQFVHEDDVVSALITLLEGRHGGAFNVTGDGVMQVAECAALIGLPRRRVPVGVMRRFASLMWRLRASEAPPGSLAFAMYPWIVSNEKLKRETDWRPRYSSRETFEITMRAHGKLPAEGPVAAVPTPAAAA
jgi:UDP-glucose 4-epimerase